MIDTQGGGIRKIFNYQRQRFFPMPDYDFEGGKVKVTLTGKILDENFAKILINNTELGMEDVMALDKVQKNREISEDEYLYLRKNKFIEGRKPKVYLSYKVIKPTGSEELMAEYVKNKSFDDEYFKKLIVEYIKKQGKTSRKAIDKLILPKLSAVLTEVQKKKKIENFLTLLQKQNIIQNASYGVWEVRDV